jgi:hypothetical protein
MNDVGYDPILIYMIISGFAALWMGRWVRRLNPGDDAAKSHVPEDFDLPAISLGRAATER